MFMCRQTHSTQYKHQFDFLAETDRFFRCKLKMLHIIRRYWMLGSFEPSEGISSFTEDGSIQADNPGTFSRCKFALPTEFFESQTLPWQGMRGNKGNQQSPSSKSSHNFL